VGAVERLDLSESLDITQRYWRRTGLNAAEHYEPDKGNWKQLMTRWNAEHPEWTHRDRRAFAGACRKAYERVTGLPLKERT
jgi:hypothetical protein